jgi:hypothetical protein
LACWLGPLLSNGRKQACMLQYFRNFKYKLTLNGLCIWRRYACITQRYCLSGRCYRNFQQNWNKHINILVQTFWIRTLNHAVIDCNTQNTVDGCLLIINLPLTNSIQIKFYHVIFCLTNLSYANSSSSRYMRKILRMKRPGRIISTAYLCVDRLVKSLVRFLANAKISLLATDQIWVPPCIQCLVWE